MSSSIPLEILDQIFVKIDFSTLKTCSLVAWDWAKLARHRLFYTVVLRSERDSAGRFLMEHVVRNANAHRHLVTYIRKLSIKEYFVVDPGPDDLDISGALKIGACFASFLRQIRLLEELDICWEDVSWDSLTQDEYRALAQVLQLNSLQRISANMKGGFPMALVSLFGVNLKTLAIGHRGIKTNRPGQPSTLLSIPAQAQIERLEIYSTNSIRKLAEFMLGDTRPSHFSLEGVRDLELGLSERLLPSTLAQSHLLFDLCPLLSNIKVYVTGHSLTRRPIVLYQALGSHVEINTWHAIHLNYKSSLFSSCLIPLFHYASSPYQVKRIHIKCNLHFLTDLLTQWMSEDFRYMWISLDDSLPALFPMLEEVEITIGFQNQATEASRTLEYLEADNHFIELRRRGIFKGFSSGRYSGHNGY